MKSRVNYVCLALTATVATVLAVPNNCSSQYQAALQKVVDLKTSCPDAVIKDCCEVSDAVTFGAELLKSNRPASGIYDINDVCGGKAHAFHKGLLTQQARCNLDDSGWMVILRRKLDVPQPVNFNRSWNEYVHGFGDLNTEFWYGLRNIHCLTSRQEVDLQLSLNFTNGSSFLWTYRHFVVDRPEDKYTLHVGQAEGPDTFNAIAYNNGCPFSTYDADNDASVLNCAQKHGGGWWYNRCNRSDLTRPRPRIWPNFMLDYVEMRVRPKLCKSYTLNTETNPVL